MLNLNTNIPPKYIKENKTLRELEPYINLGYINCRKRPYLTIVDVLNNAEGLFGYEEIQMETILSKTVARLYWEQTDAHTYGRNEAYDRIRKQDMGPAHEYHSSKILKMCQKNKTIEEVSEYIIKNIK